jgi:hypothetical protein
MNKQYHIWVFILLFFSFSAAAQFNDAGLWLSMNAEKKITPKLSAELSQDFRIHENISELGESLSEIGLSYKINKNCHVSASYRYVEKRKNDNLFNERNRYNLDLTLKKKFKPFILQYRPRFEGEYKQMRKSDDDIGPSYYLKNKLTAKLDLDKKYIPYAYYEISTTLDYSYGYCYVDEMRYCIGIEYKINRMHSLDLFYLLKKQYMSKDPETDYIIGIGYNITF